VTNIGKGARIRKQREEGTNRRNTLVTRERNPARINNPANAEKLRKWLVAKAKAFQE
jgi:hypothetical protein